MPETKAYKVEGGQRTARLDADTLPFRLYRKTAPAEAIQLEHDFGVETLEGEILTAKAGDYLMRGAHGELYPCAKEIFEDTYAPLARS